MPFPNATDDGQFSDAQAECQLSGQGTQSSDPVSQAPDAVSPQPPQRSDNRSHEASESKPLEEKVHSSEMARELKAAIKEGAKVTSPRGLNPNSPEFTPSSSSSSSSSSLNPTAQPFTPTSTRLNPHSPEFSPSSSSAMITKSSLTSPPSQNMSQSFPSKVPPPGPPKALNAAAPEFVPKIGLPSAMQNGDEPPPAEELKDSEPVPPLDEDLPVLKVEDLLRGFQQVTKLTDDGGEMLLNSAANMLLKATMYPASYDRLKKRLQTTIHAWPPSQATLANLAEMLVHWVCLLT